MRGLCGLLTSLLADSSPTPSVRRHSRRKIQLIELAWPLVVSCCSQLRGDLAQKAMTVADDLAQLLCVQQRSRLVSGPLDAF